MAMTKRDDDELLRAKEEAMKLEEELEFDKAPREIQNRWEHIASRRWFTSKIRKPIVRVWWVGWSKESFEKLVQNKSEPDILFKLAQIYEELEEIDKALSIYTKLNKEKKIAELTDKVKLHKPNESIIKEILGPFLRSRGCLCSSIWGRLQTCP